MKFRYYQGVRYVAAGNPAPSTFARCGTCGRAWDDDKPTGLTPTPSGRCPFEYMHKRVRKGNRTNARAAYYRAPWEVWEAVNPDDPCAYRIDPTGENCEIVAWADDEGCARLIAAAPELLEALERVLQHYEEAVILAGYEPTANPAVVQARAVLAKARGG